MQTLLAVLVTLTVAQGSPAVTAAIQAADKELATAVARHDRPAIVRMYTDTAEMVPPDQPAARGKADIENLWRGAFDAGVATFEVKPDDIKVDDDTADETGVYTMKLASGEVFQRGKYRTTWKKVDGTWRMQRNEWTIDS